MIGLAHVIGEVPLREEGCSLPVRAEAGFGKVGGLRIAFREWHTSQDLCDMLRLHGAHFFQEGLITFKGQDWLSGHVTL